MLGSGSGARLALLLLSSSCCWGPGHCRPPSEAAGQAAAPLSQLRAQVTGVQELLEEFRQQLQQQQRQGDTRKPEESQGPRRLQGEPASLGDVPELPRQQGEPISTVIAQGLRAEELGPGNEEYRTQREGQKSENIQEAHHKMGSLSMDATNHPDHPGDLRGAGEEQGLHNLQQLQDQGRKQQEEVGCEGRFTTLQDYIIRTKDSLAAGATFLMAPGGVSSWHQCLGTCCQEPRCSVAVVELSDYPSHQSASSLSCYLFDCTYRGHNVCTFSLHRGYNSFTSSRVNVSAHQQREPTSSYQRNLALTAEQQESDEPPRSNAGQDVVLQLPKDWVVLDGRESIDDHGIIRYEWNLLHGDPSVDMKVPQPGTIQLSHLQEGAYAFQLTVTDTAGQRSSDNITVTVLPMERRVDGCTGSCSRYQFTCDDGCCIDITLACDRVVQCPDGSDEAFCQNFGPDRKAVTHAETNNAQNPNMALHKVPDEDLEMKYDQRNNGGKQPVDTPKAEPAVPQEVQKSNDKFIPEPCISPPVIGPCKGLFSRWYFDVSSGTCMHFYYGGCKGNENNFLQEADCIAECVDVHGGSAKEVPTKSPQHANAVPELGSSGIDVKPKDDYGEIISKGKVAGGKHPAPETGAVLPLALGLAITALLLLMVVCRLRLVRQKLKKARPLTSEESDYLINGMYL